MNAALLLLLGYVVAGIILGRTPEQRPVRPPVHAPGATAPEPASSPVAKDNYAAIVERNIFGVGKPPGTPVRPTPKRLERPARTELKLRLLGTIAGDPAIARAVIEDLASKIQEVYKIGDLVQGARVETIERRRVILFRDGRKEALEVQLASRPEPGRTRPRPTRAVGRERPPREAVEILSPTQFRINKKAFLAKVGGMRALLRATKMTPYIVNGKMEGLRVTGIKNISMAKFVGLEDGDVIRALNGQKLNSRHRVRQIFKKARSLRSLDVDLLRGVDKMRLSFSVQ